VDGGQNRRVASSSGLSTSPAWWPSGWRRCAWGVMGPAAIAPIVVQVPPDPGRGLRRRRRRPQGPRPPPGQRPSSTRRGNRPVVVSAAGRQALRADQCGRLRHRHDAPTRRPGASSPSGRPDRAGQPRARGLRNSAAPASASTSCGSLVEAMGGHVRRSAAPREPVPPSTFALPRTAREAKRAGRHGGPCRRGWGEDFLHP